MKRDSSRGGYQGYVVPASAEAVTLERVDARTTSAEDFFARFVAARKPCVIVGADLPWAQFEPASLRAFAGDERVRVEVRADDNDTFGRGATTTMAFGELLTALQGGSTRYYMTTQPRTDPDGVSCPAAALPWLPRHLPLAGALRLANLNMWMGGAPPKRASNTPLHHDFQDNFYALVRGRKRFHLFSPADVDRMHTRGRVALVHPNGLINYEGFPTNADGSTLEAAEHAKRRKLGQEELHQAFACDDEDRMEAALEALLDADGAVMDDFDEAVERDSDPQSSSEPEEADVRLDHFCTVDAATARATCRTIVVDLVPHTLLYLPCGWFHQVESSNEDGDRYHCAVNWWYHPPDVVTDASAPYSTDAWQ